MAKEFFFITEKAAEQEGRRVITAVVSSEVIDRDGDIITASAMKAAMAAFMRNPVILASHQHKLDDGTSPVVGRVIDWRQEGKKTICDIEFAGTELGLQYWKLYSEKFQKAFSIGFRPISFEEKYIDGKRINVITEIMLYEISAVAVPANQDALSKSAKRKRDFVESKRGGFNPAGNAGFDVVSCLEKYDDFMAGRFDGITAEEKAFLERTIKETEELVDAFPDGYPGPCPGDIIELEFGDMSDAEKAFLRSSVKAFEDAQDTDPFDLESRPPECPTKSFYSEGQDAQGDSFSCECGRHSADSRPKTLAQVTGAKERSLIQAFGSEALYRRYLKFVHYKEQGFNHVKCGFSSDEVKMFDAVYESGIENVIQNGWNKPVDENYAKLFVR